MGKLQDFTLESGCVHGIWVPKMDIVEGMNHRTDLHCQSCWGQGGALWRCAQDIDLCMLV